MGCVGEVFTEATPTVVSVPILYLFVCISVQLEWEAINPEKKRKKKSYKNSGTIALNSFKVCINLSPKLHRSHP